MSAVTPLKLAWYQRIVMMLASFGLLGLFGLAGSLQPDTRGYGTHEQFGWSPCWFVEHWDMRCPSCGMTTSWAHLVRGNVWESLRSNSGGTALALLSLWLSWSLLASAFRGRWIGQLPGRWTGVAVVLIIGITICVDWIIRLL